MKWLNAAAVPLGVLLGLLVAGMVTGILSNETAFKVVMISWVFSLCGVVAVHDWRKWRRQRKRRIPAIAESELESEGAGGSQTQDTVPDWVVFGLLFLSGMIGVFWDWTVSIVGSSVAFAVIAFGKVRDWQRSHRGEEKRSDQT
jgi:hypothetical protein